MSKFKIDDRVIITHPSRAGARGRIITILGSGYGVHIDGTDRAGAFYYDVDMEHEPGNPSMHGEEGEPMSKFKMDEPSENYSIHQDGKEASAQSFVDRVREAQNQIHAGKKENRPAEMKKFRTDDPLAQATALVNVLHYEGKLSFQDVYVVWFCSAVKNWKALVSTNVLDNCYYEITHNGEKGETYVDKYVKVENHCVADSEFEVCAEH